MLHTGGPSSEEEKAKYLIDVVEKEQSGSFQYKDHMSRVICDQLIFGKPSK